MLGSILGAMKAIVNVIGMPKMSPPIKDLLPRLTPILKNRHEKVPQGRRETAGVGVSGIPVATPNNFQDVPASAPEDTFKLLNDLSVSSNRSVQTLQVAVDDKFKIIQFLSTG